MLKNIYEIFDEFSSKTNKSDRIKVLHENNTNHLRQLLKYTFDPQYQFYISEFPKNYKKPDTLPGIRIAGIESEIKRAYLFLKGNETADKLTPQKMNQLLVTLLESFEPREAEVFVNMMKKNLRVPFLTKNLVDEAFPGLIPS